MSNNIKIKILIFIVTVILLVLMFPHGEALDSEIAVGSIWTKSDLIAKMSFPILKDEKEYETEKIQAARKVFPVFVFQKKSPQRCLKKFDSFFDSLRSITSVVNDSLIQSVKLPIKKETLLFFLRRKKEQKLISFNGKKIPEIKKTIKQALFTVCKKGILNLSYKEIKRDTISLRKDKYEKDILTKSLFDLDSAKKYVLDILRKNLSDENEIDASYDIITKFIKPTYRYSETYTSQARQLAMEKVPRYIGIVNENERIVAKHDRITPEIKLKIDSYRIAKGEEKNVFETILEFVGKTFHIAVILFLFGLYLKFSRRKIFENDKYILLISLIILFTALQAFTLQFVDVKVPFDFLILVPLASMLLTIVFDSRVGFIGTIIIAIIVGGLRGNDYIITFTHISAGGFAVYSVRDIKNRNQIFRSFFHILIGFTFVILAFGFERYVAFTDMIFQFAFSASNSLISPIMTFGFLYIIEKLFNISTDLTYLELSDFNNPLLRELNLKAPGTFSHSMAIGNMVEKAAREIGANSTLARVGAYYHDIGKTYYPQAFIENQQDGRNVHDSLPPEESAKIIIEHVTKGIELAKENNLPQEIIDFIPTHHGTLLVTYFYEKAKKLYGEENVNINDYRYPGPKPRTKETGLVMLADACESAVRAMNDFEATKIENLVSNIIEERLRDGQLDETNLNFSHIKKIRDIFVQELLTTHHQRVRYPNQEKLEESHSSEKS